MVTRDQLIRDQISVKITLGIQIVWKFISEGRSFFFIRVASSRPYSIQYFHKNLISTQLRYVILLVELSISIFEIFHFGQWPFGGAILKKSAIFCISETINRIVLKLFLDQFWYIERLQKFQKQYYRVIQIWEKAFFWKFAIF